VAAISYIAINRRFQVAAMILLACVLKKAMFVPFVMILKDLLHNLSWLQQPIPADGFVYLVDFDTRSFNIVDEALLVSDESIGDI